MKTDEEVINKICIYNKYKQITAKHIAWYDKKLTEKYSWFKYRKKIKKYKKRIEVLNIFLYGLEQAYEELVWCFVSPPTKLVNFSL